MLTRTRPLPPVLLSWLVMNPKQGLILGMQAAAWLGVRRLLAQGDSQLICLQVSGEYQVKAPHLRPLVEFVRGLAASFDEFNLRYVPREQNTVADDLSNQAIDLGTVL